VRWLNDLRRANQEQQVVDAVQGIPGLQLPPDRWQALSPIQKAEVAQQLEDAHAAATGRPPVPIVLDTNMDPRILGQYNHGLNDKLQLVEPPTITLNPSRLGPNMGPPELTNTILHEGQHGYQYYSIANPGTHFEPAEVDIWKNNAPPYGVYRSGNQYGYDSYREQPIEIDAHDVADNVTRRVFGVPGRTPGPRGI
jgi:hypothetical protein